MSAKGTADDETLDLVFKALSNGTRRRILDLLKDHPRTTGDLCANFPALVLSIFWRRTSTVGAATSMAVGALSTLTLIALSPAVQVDLLHHPQAIFPLKNPALVTIPLSFLTGIIVSLLKPDADGDARYVTMERRLLLGAE